MPQNLVASHLLTTHERDHGFGILLRSTKTKDAGNRGHDQRIATSQQGSGRGVTQLVDLFIDIRILLNEGIGAGNIGFWLVVIVVRNEVFHRVIREEFLELTVELSRQRLVVRKHEGRAVHLFHDVGHRECFAGSSDTQQCLEPFFVIESGNKFFDCGGLIARRAQIGDDIEVRHGVSCLSESDHLFDYSGCRQLSASCSSLIVSSTSRSESDPVSGSSTGGTESLIPWVGCQISASIR